MVLFSYVLCFGSHKRKEIAVERFIKILFYSYYTVLINMLYTINSLKSNIKFIFSWVSGYVCKYK